MLSLKSPLLTQSALGATTIRHLPLELLNYILSFLDENDVVAFESLLSASLVSRLWRDSASPIIFRVINITFTLRVQKFRETLLDFLLRKTSLQGLIREVRIRPAIPGFEVQYQEWVKFEKLLPLLKNLRDFRLPHWDRFTPKVLALLKPIPTDVRLHFTSRVLDVSQFERVFRLAPSDKSSSPQAGDFQGGLDNWRIVSQDIHVSQSPAPLGLHQTRFQGTISDFRQLRSLSICVELSNRERYSTAVDEEVIIDEIASNVPMLEELRLGICWRGQGQPNGWTLNFLDALPWSTLKKLSLSGNELIEEVLPRIEGSTLQLRSLRLEAYNPFRNVAPPQISSSLFRRFSSLGGWFTMSKLLIVTSAFLTNTQHELEELELEGYSNSLQLPRATVANLRKLKLHVCEVDPIYVRANVRAADDIRRYADMAPNLKHLELDLAHVGKLWHPLAIPGVDVDMRMYHLLDAIATFPALKHLRLFPHYYDSTDQISGHFTQPLTDDGAVRLFQNLRSKIPSLQSLSISSDSFIATRIKDFDPMSWDVCALGNTVVLTVRQANHDYEQRQVWVGERRLRTEIRRFSYQKPYLAEFEDWISQD